VDEPVEDTDAVPHAADRDTDVTAYSTGEADSDGADQSGRKERLPGMEPHWQEENFAWPTLQLDVDHLPPPDPRREPLTPEEDPKQTTPRGKPETSANDDPEPRPAEQPPLDGRL
jgi:hypothetical protein